MVETADTRRLEGRGQVKPGPSRFAVLPLSGRGLFAVAVVLVGAVSRFLFGTVLSDSAGFHGAAIATGVITGVVFLMWGAGGKIAIPAPGRLMALVAGSLLAVAVPALLQFNQHSDAPAGSVVLFWTALIPGMLLLVVASRWEWRSRLWALAIALIAGAGGAGVLSNWERPSSFTLLNRYVSEQMGLGAASLVWVAAVLVLAWLARSSSSRPVLFWAGLGALAGSALTFAATGGSALAELTDPVAWLYGASFSAVSFVTVWWLERGDASVPFVGLVLVPTALSLMVFVESATGSLGPEPILRLPVIWASVTVLAAALVAMWHAGRPVLQLRTGIAGNVRAWASVGIVICAALGMLAPALGVEVQGRLADFSRFAAQFEMRGFESVGGWLAMGVALLALALANSDIRRTTIAASLVLALVLGGAWFVLGATPLHTWVSWIPPDVQQDYGTEFATIAFSPLARTWQLAAVLLSVLLIAWEALFQKVVSPSVLVKERDVS